MDERGRVTDDGAIASGVAMRIPLSMSLAKTASFAVLHFSIAFGLGWWLTGSVAIAGTLALLEPLVNTVAFFFHDRAWARWQPGSRASPETVKA